MGFAMQAVADFEQIVIGNREGLDKRISKHSSGAPFVLHLLLEHEHGGAGYSVHPSDLQDCTGTSAARVTVILDNLEKKGLIQRSADPTDKRKVLVCLTDDGRATAEAEYNAVCAELAAVFTSMGKRDTAEFLRLLKLFLETYVGSDGTEGGAR